MGGADVPEARCRREGDRGRGHSNEAQVYKVISQIAEQIRSGDIIVNRLSLIRWAGGKGNQLNDLLPLIPMTRLYVEPFGGGASVLLNRERSEVEVYNDLDSALVNLFDVLRDRATFWEFVRQVHLTPYSRETFEKATEFDDEPDSVTRAAMFYTFMGQGFSGKRLARKSEWSRDRISNLAERWFSKQDSLIYIHERLKHVQIECRDALDILVEWDTPDTTFYCDPPYILDTRKKKKYYAVEPGDEYHNELVDRLVQVQGCVVLSGYDHPIYTRLVDDHGWWTDLYGASATMDVKREEKKAARKEVVYRNPRACEFGNRNPLFDASTFAGVVADERDRVRQQYETQTD